MSVLTLVLTAVQTASGATPAPSVPFRVGERFDYGAKLSLFSVGTAAYRSRRSIPCVASLSFTSNTTWTPPHRSACTG